MKRWLPAPLVSATLLVVWLLLESSLDPGTLILGAVIALGAPLLAAPLRPLPVRVRRPGVILRLMVAVVAVNAAGVGILMVEQNARQALAVAHRGFVLATGRNRLTDTGPALLANREVALSFLGG